MKECNTKNRKLMEFFAVTRLHSTEADIWTQINVEVVKP